MDIVRYFLSDLTKAYYMFLDAYNDNFIVMLLIVAVFILSISYGFYQMYQSAKNEKNGYMEDTFGFAIISTLVFAAFIGGLSYYVYDTIPKDRVLSSSTAEELSKKTVVQLNDTVGVYKVVESYNQTVQKEYDEYYSQFLISDIQHTNSDSSFDTYQAKFSKLGGEIQYYVNKSGFISGALIVLPHYNIENDAFIIRTFIKSSTALEINPEVLKEVTRDIIKDERAGIYSLLGDRYFILTKPIKDKKTGKPQNHAILIQAFVEK